MIPKKIHYVWVGGNPIPKDLQKCINSWHNHLPDYEIKEWNEKNFDIENHPFVKAAYQAKKWAFVSDYIRAYALYTEGGIYLDTDNLVLTNLDSLLNHKAFVGYENPDYPFTACFGTEKGHPLVKMILNQYDTTNFKYDKNDELAEVNTKSVSELLIKNFNCEVGNVEQNLKTGIHVYKDDVLCNPSKNSKVIHIFTGTWMENSKPLKRKLIKFLKLRLTTPKRAEIYRRFIGR